ncbi:hypothetical protein [Verminephrobacter eiseniae]|uniref:hypothetical protein n=1 Tax=Verminephrobacter eiseniae TaxID=364317 RepID=UPI0022373331|nr:hypothetical protein [Verminephrobacter eiseniae]
MASIGRNKQCRDCRFRPESRQCAVSKGEIDACFLLLTGGWTPCGGWRLGAGRAHGAIQLRSSSGQIPDFDGAHLIGRASGDPVLVQDDFAHTGCAFASTLARNFGGRSAGSSDEGHGHTGPDQFPLHIIRQYSLPDMVDMLFNLCVNADM